MSEAHVPTQQPEARQEARVSSPDVDPRGSSHHKSTPGKGTPQTQRLIWRVERRQIFAELRHGKRSRVGPITVSWIEADEGHALRVAYAIGHRVGPAVQRNRLRRRLRAIVREVCTSLRPGSYLITARPEATSLSFSDLRLTLAQALATLVRQ